MPRDRAARTQPLKPYFRWVVFGVVSLTCFAQYFVYDSIAPLMPILRQRLGLTGFQYGLALSSSYSVANILMLLLVAGVLLDRLGIRFCGIVYTLLCVIGTGLTAWGIGTTNLPLMFVGRAIFGLGAESILLVNNKVLGRWFSGKELAFAFGLNLTLMRAGSLLAGVFQPQIEEHWGFVPSLILPVGVMVLGLLTFFAYLMMERLASGAPNAPAASIGAPSHGAASESFRLREVFSFNRSFWLITLLCVAFYSAIFPFQQFATDMLCQRFGYSTAKAGIIAYSLTAATMIFTPLFGILIDRRGRRPTLMILGSLLIIPCYLLLGFTSIPPLIPIFFVGIAFSLVPAALWASIPLMVPSTRQGTAFGLIGYVQNIGLFVFPTLAGLLADRFTKTAIVDGASTTVVDYTWTIVMFAGLGVIGLVFALAFKAVDKKNGSFLERPGADVAPEQILPEVSFPA